MGLAVKRKLIWILYALALLMGLQAATQAVADFAPQGDALHVRMFRQWLFVDWPHDCINSVVSFYSRRKRDTVDTPFSLFLLLLLD